MKPVLTAQQTREAEEAFWAEHPGVDLMGRAASAVAAVAREMLAGRRTAGPRPIVVVAAGQGNNAGDALIAASELDAEVLVWAASDKTHPAGLVKALGAGARLVSRAEALDALAEADLVIDGVAGIGSRRGLMDSVEKFAARAQRERVPVLAVDVPSGLAADRVDPGEAPSFRATRTITFISHKIAHLATPAAQVCGEVDLIDIGVEPRGARIWQVEETDLPGWYPWPTLTSQKYSRGVVGFDTGSVDYPGAAMLGAAGALFTGTGMVRHAGADEVAAQVVQRWPSVVGAPGRVQAWVCGSGWAQPDGEQLAKRVVDGVPMVLDAGALEVLPGKLPPGSLLTPHAGELAKLLGIGREQVEQDPITHVRSAAQRTRQTVLLKGATQYVAVPDGEIWVAVRGPAWNAQAGSGDVLAGACGALLAAGLEARVAAVLAASLQAIASSHRPGPMPPDRLVEAFTDVIAGWDDLRER